MIGLFVSIALPIALGAQLGWRRGCLTAMLLWAVIIAITAVADKAPGGDFYVLGAILGFPYAALLAAVGAGAKGVLKSR